MAVWMECFRILIYRQRTVRFYYSFERWFVRVVLDYLMDVFVWFSVHVGKISDKRRENDYIMMFFRMKLFFLLKILLILVVFALIRMFALKKMFTVKPDKVDWYASAFFSGNFSLKNATGKVSVTVTECFLFKYHFRLIVRRSRSSTQDSNV